MSYTEISVIESVEPQSVPKSTTRAVFAVVGIAAWFITQRLLASRGFPEGIGDGVHLFLTPATEWLTRHNQAADVLLIITSGIIDALGCFLLLSGILGRSVRPMLGLMLLFLLRQICQALTALPPPEGMIWRYPGVPSLFVTYGTANDFFFSGHTAIAVYGAMELARLRHRWLTVAGAAIAAIEALTVLVLRAHYTMDVFTAILAAAWAASVALRLAPSCDRALVRCFTRRSNTEAGALLFSGGGHHCPKKKDLPIAGFSKTIEDYQRVLRQVKTLDGEDLLPECKELINVDRKIY